MEKVSIIVPVIRPKNMPALLKMIEKNAGVKNDQYEVMWKEDTERIGAPKMVKALTEMTSFKLVMFIGDDCQPQKNFIKLAVAEMEKFPGKWGLVGLRDLERPGVHAPTHWLAHKKLLEWTGGEFFHTGYIHQYCDNELHLWATCLNRYSLSKAIVSHQHAGFKNKKKSFRENIAASKDADIKRVYSQEVHDHDQALFLERRKMIIASTESVWSKKLPK